MTLYSVCVAVGERCVVPNVPPDGRPPAKMVPFAGKVDEFVAGHKPLKVFHIRIVLSH